jgi:tetratricopeptide (TPR) repeat protein
MASLLKIVATLGLIALFYWMFQQAGLEQAKENPDQSAIVVYWGGMILVSVGLAALFAFTVLPMVGNLFAGMLYSAPNAAPEKGPHSNALAKIAAGDYEAAVEEYEKAWQKNPSDVMAMVEIAKLLTDRLHNPEAAAARLETALAQDMDRDLVGPLSFRLADIYWKNMDDPQRARALLEQIVEVLPETTHAANASHRIREIDEQERVRQEQEFIAGATTSQDEDEAPR